jgi:hypothetical protein
LPHFGFTGFALENFVGHSNQYSMYEFGCWTTRKREDGRIEWIPPPHLESGQTRVNDYHHPEKYRLPDDGDDP